MAQHTFETTQAQEEALVGMAEAVGKTVDEFVESQVLRFLPEVENQWSQAKRNRVADAYEVAKAEDKAAIDAVVEKIKTDAQAEQI